ncbi:hypothetical protein ACS0TY_019485 [Phlomoides rotata]
MGKKDLMENDKNKLEVTSILFIFPSRYLFAIGLSPVFSLGRNLPPDWGCIPKQPDSPTAPCGAAGSEHDGSLTLYGAPFQGTWARSAAEDASPDYNSDGVAARFSSWAIPGSLAVTRGILRVIPPDLGSRSWARCMLAPLGFCAVSGPTTPCGATARGWHEVGTGLAKYLSGLTRGWHKVVRVGTGLAGGWLEVGRGLARGVGTGLARGWQRVDINSKSCKSWQKELARGWQDVGKGLTYVPRALRVGTGLSRGWQRLLGETLLVETVYYVSTLYAYEN